MKFRTLAPLVCAALLNGALGLAAGAAHAGPIVSPQVSYTAERINLVGYDPAVTGAQADSTAPLAKLGVCVRDVATNPIAGEVVQLDFSLCTSDLRVASTQSFRSVTTSSCAGPVVQAVTGADGYAWFVVIGAGVAGGAAHPAHAVMVTIVGEPYTGWLGVGVYDLNGGGGVTLADLGAWAKDYFGAASPDRADYDGNGLVSLSDLGAFTECFFDHRSVASPATLCP